MSKDFYLPTIEECSEAYAENEKWILGKGGYEASPLMIFIYRFQPVNEMHADIWRAALQLAANDIADQAIDSLM